MTKNTTEVVERLKCAMLTDTNSSIETLSRVLKSDIFSILSEYMLLTPESLKIEFSASESGQIHLNIHAVTSQIITLGYSPME